MKHLSALLVCYSYCAVGAQSPCEWPAEGYDYICYQCNAGWELNYDDKICICDNGTPATGVDCTTNGDHTCANCNDGGTVSTYGKCTTTVAVTTTSATTTTTEEPTTTKECHSSSTGVEQGADYGIACLCASTQICVGSDTKCVQSDGTNTAFSLWWLDDDCATCTCETPTTTIAAPTTTIAGCSIAIHNGGCNGDANAVCSNDGGINTRDCTCPFGYSGTETGIADTASFSGSCSVLYKVSTDVCAQGKHINNKVECELAAFAIKGELSLSSDYHDNDKVIAIDTMYVYGPMGCYWDPSITGEQLLYFNSATNDVQAGTVLFRTICKISGCTNSGASNYDDTATVDDGTCIFLICVVPVVVGHTGCDSLVTGGTCTQTCLPGYTASGTGAYSCPSGTPVPGPDPLICTDVNSCARGVGATIDIDGCSGDTFNGFPYTAKCEDLGPNKRRCTCINTDSYAEMTDDVSFASTSHGSCMSRRERRGLISKTASGDTAPHRDRRADGELAANWTRYEVLSAVEGVDTFIYRDTLGIDHAFRIKEGLVVVFPSGSLHWVNSTNPQRSMRSFTTSDATGEPVGDDISFIPGTSDYMVGRCEQCATGKFRPQGVPSFVKCAPYTVCDTDFEVESEVS